MNTIIHIILEMILLVKIAKDYQEIKGLKESRSFLRLQFDHLLDISKIEVRVIDNMRNDLVNKLNSHRYKLAPKYTKGEKQVAEQINAIFDRLIEDIK